VSERISNEIAKQELERLKKISEQFLEQNKFREFKNIVTDKSEKIIIGKECFYLSPKVRQALDIAIECVEEKIKREKNAHRGKREACWIYTGNGDDLGRWLEIQCSWCNKKFKISSPDENYKFSYETAQKDLDKYCPTECPSCKRKMIGWRKYHHPYQTPNPIRFFEGSDKE